MRNFIISIVCVFSCFGCATGFDTYYDLDEYDLDFIYELEDNTTELSFNETSRFVKTDEQGIRLFLENPETTYEAYEGIKPEYQSFGIAGYCGPSMLVNIARWYNFSVTIDEAAKKMKTNNYVYKKKIYTSCASMCAGDFIICTNVCYDAIKNLSKQGGSRVNLGFKTVKHYVPEGYAFKYVEEDPYAIEDILKQLLKGNPIVISEYLTKRQAFHFSLLTGIDFDENGEIYVRMVNSSRRTLDEFMYDWSLDGSGDDSHKRNIKRFSGLKPFMAAWYEKIK